MKDKIKELLKKLQEKIAGLDDKQRYWIFAGILVFIFLLDYLILMRPQLNTLSKINPEIKLLKDDLKKAKDDIQKIDYYKGEVEKLKGSVSEANIKVKPKEAVPLVLEHISRIADQNGVVINQIMPEPEGQEVAIQNPERIYYRLPISVEARGGYHQFGRFINALENGEVYIEVKTFSISSAGVETRQHKINLKLDAVIYENVVKE